MDRTSQRFRTLVTLEHRALGVAFLALLALFGWLTHAIFAKSFVDYERVELRSSKIGLQLGSRADVKIRGVVVGEVLETEATAEGATLTLGLYPQAIETIPADVSASILPKTLFGEKFVALEVPDQPSTRALAAGDVIEQSEVAIEVEQVLENLYPLLRTVQPAELNHTLTAIATALEGRGRQIGENLSTLDDYLQRTNPQIPVLVEDLRLLSEVSDVYRSAVPQIARTLRNTVTTGATFIEKEQKIQSLFADVASLSSTSRDFLEQNGDNIIRLGELGQQSLPMFARYSPEYPCLLDGIVKLAPRQAESFRGYTLHINLEQLPLQPRGFGVQDDAVYGDRRGPHDEQLCRRAINDEWGQGNLPPDSLVPDIVDGVDEPTGKQPARVAPDTGEQAVVDLTSGYAGTGAERDLVAMLAAPQLGLSVDEVPDVSTLLFGPLARGTEVSAR